MSANRWLAMVSSLLGLAGCGWTGPTERAPTLPVAERAAEPTLLLETFDCRGTPEAQGKTIVSVTSVGQEALGAMDRFIAGLNRAVKPIRAGHVNACGIFGRGFDAAWSATAVDPIWVRSLTEKTGARSVLITAVSSTYKCTNDGLSAGGTYVEYGTSRCYEPEVDIAAVIVDAQGRALWRSRRRATMAGPDYAPPLVGEGVAAVFESVPIGDIIGEPNR